MTTRNPPFRLPAGGRLIDRAARRDFRFDGRPLSGLAGDTLASALLANGQLMMGRSFKYHRPRGPIASGAEEPNALLGLGQGGRFEPNQRATTTPLVQGMVTTSQNAWPSLDRDIGAINDALWRFFPAGFYYKTFIHPRAAWKHLFEPVIRRAAGLGRARHREGARVDEPDIPFLRYLDADAAQAIRDRLASVAVVGGQVLFHEGDAEDRLYVVITGKIKLGRSGSAGRENLLAILGPGQMFGELSLFDPGPRSTTATAVTACEIRTLEHDELMGWLGGRPEVALGLLGQLAARLRRANDVVADLVFSDLPGRVAKQLLELARRFGDRKDDGVHVHHDLTQEELAQLVGASRETVNKALADFASRGWIRLEPRSVVIMEVDRLQRRAR